MYRQSQKFDHCLLKKYGNKVTVKIIEYYFNFDEKLDFIK